MTNSDDIEALFLTRPLSASEAEGIDDEDTSNPDSFAAFDSNLVRIETTQPTIDLILQRIGNGEMDLSPGFQRKGGIWDEQTQSRLIESLLVRIPLPAFYFDATDDEKWLVVDGLQRLMTLQNFILRNELRLRDLEFLEPLNGRQYRDLPRHFQRRLLETQITAHRIQPGTPAQVKFTVFKRINTGGLPLSAQEIRNALNQGQATDFLTELARSSEFKLATDFGIRDDRMADRECVLRFTAFMRTNYQSYRDNNFDLFLSTVMADLNRQPPSVLEDLRIRFSRAMDLSLRLFENHAFRKLKQNLPRPPINKALFEVWSVTLAQLTDHQAKEALLHRDTIREEYEKLYLEDPSFADSISFATGNPNKIRYRFAAIENLLKRAVL